MACPEGVKRQMIDWWGPVLTEYYGASEGGAVTLISSQEWLSRTGSVGRPIPPHRVHIVGEDGKPLPRGEPGAVYIERPGRAFRYHNAPERTGAAFLRPGVFTYGEVGHLDDDGYLYLTGRAKDMIITGGVNVYPAEVEAVLLRHPSVRDVAVVGVPDAEFGERVVAIVELESDQDNPMWAELDRHCRRTLAGFKVPRQYRAVESLPRQESGKVSKQALQELVQA
jgi:long-chain acyl-CoA synthetase